MVACYKWAWVKEEGRHSVSLETMYFIIAISFLSLFLLPGFEGVNAFLLSHHSSQCPHFVIGLRVIHKADRAPKPLRSRAEINLHLPLAIFWGIRYSHGKAY